MQAIKDKVHEIGEMRKAKSEAKAQEKAEKDIAKARVNIAREVRLAREAEAEMEMHVEKAGELAQREREKIAPNMTSQNPINPNNLRH